MPAFRPGDEDVPLLHALGEGVADDSRATRTWATRASACFVAALFVAAGVVGASSPSARASLGLEKVLTPAERVVGDPVVADVKSLPPDPTEKKPFTAMEGMFAYEGWTQSLFEETQDDRPLLQQLPKYGASVDWSRIMAALNSGIGKNGQRKLFLFIRHGKATHNEWGTLQHHAHDGADIPCDFKTPGDLVDPDLTDLGKSDAVKYVRDVFRDGLGAAIDKKAKVFSSPLARCMETTLRMLTNQTGLRVAGDLVTVSELLRERIDARVPFELRRPVSFVPDVVIKVEAAEAAAEAAKKNGAAELSGQGGARGPGGMCWEPSKGLTGHEGRCCVHDGLLEKFGDYGVFDINVATPSFLNVEVSEQDADLKWEDQPKVDETGEPIAHHVKELKYVGASCGLTEVANKGWQACTGPEMLGLLAEDDLALGSKEESEFALVERVRTWFSSVYDHVEENVVIAVTHSDWIKLALQELDIKKPWVVPKNGEIFPIIVEDTRTSVPGWIEKREARKRQVNSATEKGGVIDLTHGLGAHEKVLNALRMSDEAAEQAASTAAAAERAAAVERRAAEAAKVAADQARAAEVAAQRAIAEANSADAAAPAKTKNAEASNGNAASAR